MIMLVPLTHHTEWTWIKDRTHLIACEDAQGLVAYDGNNQIVAAAVFDTFTTDACSVHFAIANPMCIRRGFLHEIARHLFVVCGRKRIFGQVPENNVRALKMDRRIGFTEVTRIPDALAEGIGLVIMRMDKEDCRWLPQELKEVA